MISQRLECLVRGRRDEIVFVPIGREEFPITADTTNMVEAALEFL